MKKVIDGALYNTETARLVGSWDNGKVGNSQVFEWLYQNRAGKYFKYAGGGPESPYAIHHGNEAGWGDLILPLSLEEAREWGESKMLADAYAAEFGDVPEAAEGRRPVTITLPADVLEILKREKARTGETYSALIEFAVRAAAGKA